MKKKGFTLVEVIISFGFVTVMLLVSISMIRLGSVALQRGTEEFDVQSGARTAAEAITQTTRYSTVMYTIPEDYFRVWDNATNDYDTTKLTREWSYLGVVDVPINAQMSSSVVNFVWDASIAPNGDWRRITILAPREGVRYTMNFDKDFDNNNDNVLGFSIEGIRDDSTDIVIDSQADSLNALQVMTRGGSGDTMTAIAYRLDSRPSQVTVDVALICDTSGSMRWRYTGTGSVADNVSDERINALKDAGTLFMNTIVRNENINVVLVPFATSANNVGDFRNLGTDAARLATIADINGLDAVGGTNIGDGMRRAYHRLADDNAANPGVTFQNYAILFTDGAPTYHSLAFRTPGDANYNTASPDGMSGIYWQDGGVNREIAKTVFTLINRAPANTSNEFCMRDGDAIEALTNNGANTPFGGLVRVAGSENPAIWQRPNPPLAQAAVINDAIRAGNIRNMGVVAGPGSGFNDHSVTYIEQFTPLLQALDTEIFYISFVGAAAPIDDRNGAIDVRDALGINEGDTDHFFTVQDPVQMNAAFRKIAETINDQFWHISGPELIR